VASTGRVSSRGPAPEGADIVAEPQHDPRLLRGLPQDVHRLPTGPPPSRLGLSHSAHPENEHRCVDRARTEPVISESGV